MFPWFICSETNTGGVQNWNNREHLYKKLRKNIMYLLYSMQNIYLNYLNCSVLKNKLIYLCDHGKKRNQSANKNQHEVLIICFTE